MGRGRKKTPDRLKALKDGQKYATPTGDAPPPPDYLDDVGRHTWETLAPDLAASGRLSQEFLPAFTAYCQAVAEHRIATLEMQKPGGRVVACGAGTKQSPWVGMQREAARLIKDVGSLFLLNPLSLARGPAVAAKTAERDQLDDFLSTGGAS